MAEAPLRWSSTDWRSAGITGHKDFARDTGIVLPPGEAVRVADAIVQVFSENGDRTDRNRAPPEICARCLGLR